MLNTGSSTQQTSYTLKNWYNRLLSVSFRTHLLISALLRLALICYGHLHDTHSEVPYTDIDYKVVTDGARHILEGRSPFERHTYRYSPILAYMQLPNILLHSAVGKVIYSSFDLMVAVLIYILVRAELQAQCYKAVQSLLQKMGKPMVSTSIAKNTANNCYHETDERNRPEKIARASACFWLYNPLTAVISTRGNGDSFSSFFVIMSIYLLAKAADNDAAGKRSCWLVFCAGLAHGFAIHLRLYPLLFSLAYYLSLSTRMTRTLRDLLRLLFWPTWQQITLVLGTLTGLITFTLLFYRLYGWQYIYEAYLYHFLRKDVRHNFSLYFLLQYLESGRGDTLDIDHAATSICARILILMPQFLLLIYISFSFGQFRQTLPFCVFSLAYVLVTFNTVVTSQYFVWYLALLPLCLNNLQTISWQTGISYALLWLGAQALWLLPAYLLEFHCWNTFYWIGAQAAVFFLVNCFILTRLIQNYSFTYFKVNFKKLF